MSVREIRETDRLVAVFPDLPLEELVAGLGPPIQPFVDLKFRGRTPVGHNAIIDPEPPRNQAVFGRHARGIGAVIVREPCSIPGNDIDRRRGRSVIAIAAQVVGSEAIDIKIDDSHAPKLIGFGPSEK
jgi:hypothetical protein